MPIGVGVVGALVREGQILLVRLTYGQNKGRWGLPGGHVEAVERLDEAVVREVQEEAGVTCRSLGPAGVFRHVRPDGAGSLTVVMQLAYAGGEPRPDGREADAAGWFDAAGVEALRAADQMGPFHNAVARRAVAGTLQVLPAVPDQPGRREIYA